MRILEDRVVLTEGELELAKSAKKFDPASAAMWFGTKVRKNSPELYESLGQDSIRKAYKLFAAGKYEVE